MSAKMLGFALGVRGSNLLSNALRDVLDPWLCGA